jgi:hypothetical protein
MNPIPALLCAGCLLAGCQSARISPGMLQPEAPARRVAPPKPPADLPEVTPDLVASAIAEGVKHLLDMQEGDAKDQWPYEGVYRVKGEIPLGYRVGGTAIAVMALAHAPGYADDPPRQEAVARALRFICEGRRHPDMAIDTYEGGYDVRAWGYIEAVQCICLLKRLAIVPEDQKAPADEALAWYLDALQKIELPRTGGWNYARPPGADTLGAPSPFMTAPALQALFEARALGYEVDAAVVDRALDVLEKARTAAGSVVYSGAPTPRDDARTNNATPGAVGRMNCTESVLLLAGRSSPDRVRAAVDAFIVHWGWLEQRRAKTGTHVGPYSVAPYYFMFAHLYTAQSVEMLPPSERAEYRRRVLELMFSVRQDDGRWNDRVFDRSGAYGTAMAMLTMLQPTIKPAGWQPGAAPGGIQP